MKSIYVLYNFTNSMQTVITNVVMMMIYIASYMAVYYVISESRIGCYVSETSKIIPDSLNWTDPNLADVFKEELKKNLEQNSGNKPSKYKADVNRHNDSDSIHCLVGIDERLISNDLIVNRDKFRLKERGVCFLTNDLDQVFYPTMRFVVTYSFECDSIGQIADIYISKEAALRLGMFSEQKCFGFFRILLQPSHALERYGLIME